MKETIFTRKVFLKTKNLHPKSYDATRFLFKGYRWLGIYAPKKHRTTYAIYSVLMNLMSCILLPASFITTVITSKSDIKVLLTSIHTGMNISGIAVKFAIIAFYLPKLCKSKFIIDKLDSRCQAEYERDKIRSAVRFGNKAVLSILLFYLGVTQAIFSGVFVSKTPPYSLFIPFLDWKRSNFDLIIQTCIEYVTISIACMQQAVNDAYSLIFLNVIKTHVQILRLKIENLGATEGRTKDEDTKDLLNCIIYHKYILELFDVVSQVISKTVFIHFLSTAAELSITMVSLTAFPTPVETFVAFVIYMFAISLGLFPCCFVAHSLMDESDLLSSTIFHCNWIHQDGNFKKMILFFMHRSQETIKLSAGKMIPITLESFVAVAKFTFSLYTLFSQLDLNFE